MQRSRGRKQQKFSATRSCVVCCFVYLPGLAVQWSTAPDFSLVGGELEVRDTDKWKRGGEELNEINLTLNDCPSNARCYFRVAAGNLSGYGSFKTTLPSSVLLSGKAHASITKEKGKTPRLLINTPGPSIFCFSFLLIALKL